MKLGASCAELVQFVQKNLPRSCVRIFRNKHTWSTPLDPKLMFWCVSQCLGACGIVSLLHETWCELDWTSAINAKSSWSRVITFCNKRTQSAPLLHWGASWACTHHPLDMHHFLRLNLDMEVIDEGIWRWFSKDSASYIIENSWTTNLNCFVGYVC